MKAKKLFNNYREFCKKKKIRVVMTLHDFKEMEYQQKMREIEKEKNASK